MVSNERGQPSIELKGTWSYNFGIANDGTIDMARITKIVDSILEQLEEGNRESISSEQVDLLISLLPVWAINRPAKGMDPTMYGTGSFEEDLKVYRKVLEIKEFVERQSR